MLSKRLVTELRKSNRVRKLFLLLIILILGGILLPTGIITTAVKAKAYTTRTSQANQHPIITKNIAHKTIELPNLSAQGKLDSPSKLSLDVTKTHTPSIFFQNGIGKFIITITNNLTETIPNGISITDSLPTGLSYKAIEHSNAWSCSSPPTTPITCTYPATIETSTDLDPIIITVGAELTDTVTNTLTVAENSNPTDIVTTTDTVTINAIELKKTVSKSSAYEGESIKYILEVENKGPEVLSDLTISDTLPGDLTFISGDPIGEYNPNTSIWTIGDLAVGESKVLTITLRIKSGIGAKTIDNKAELLLSNMPTGISDSATINILSASDLIISKADSLDYVYPGYIFTYTVFITNFGSISAENVIITDVLGTDYSIITDTLDYTRTSVTANKFVWAPVPKIDAGKVLSFFIRVKTKSSLTDPPNLTNHISVSTDSPEGNTDNNWAEDTNTAVNLSVSKTVSPGSANVGTNLKFVITAKNTGNSNATNMIITDAYPSVLDITRAVTTIGTATINNTNHTIKVSVGSLPHGQTVTVYVDARVNSTAKGTKTYVNNAILTASTPSGKPVLPNKYAKVSFTVTGSSLPPTGGIPAGTMKQSAFAANLALIVSVIFSFVGISILFYAFLYWKKNPDWAPWFLRIGIIFLIATFIFGFLGIVLLWSDFYPQKAENLLKTQPVHISTQSIQEPLLSSIQFQEPYNPDPSSEIPEELPNYPIPTPSPENIPNNTEEQIDTSPITRIVIPAIDLDTIVKYVPYSEYTWLIAGLKQEIAWMGNTSWPGLGSNTGLAGHVTLRDGSVGPFYELNELQPGDEIILYTEEKVYHYTIREKTIVDDSNLSIVGPTANSQITLITCTDWDETERIYKNRLIVFADLVNSSTFQSNIQDENYP